MLFQPARPHGGFTRWFGHLGAFGLFLLAILDSSPLPTFGGPDILIIILVATRPYPWYEYAGVATAGSVIGAFITFRLARHAGEAYIEQKFAKSGSVSRLLSAFKRWGTGALAASAAIPFPLPTSVFFAAAGASKSYSTPRYLTVVAICRGARYSAVALIAHHYGRHIIRVLRHPAQYWHWLLLFAMLFIAIVAIGIFLNRRSQATPAWTSRRVAS